MKAEQELDYIKLLKILFSRWYWIIGALSIGSLTAHIYLCFTPSLYRASALIKFEDKKSELSELVSIRNFYDRTNKAESEKPVIKSRRILSGAIKSLNYHTSFYIRKNFQLVEIYPKRPFKIQIFNKTSHFTGETLFEFKAINASEYLLNYTDNKQTVERIFHYNQLVKTRQITFEITPPETAISPGTTYTFKFIHESDLERRISRALRIDEGQSINMMNIDLSYSNPYFAADLLNAILEEYIKFDKYQRSSSVAQITSYVTELLTNLSSKTNNSALAIQLFKEKHPMLGLSQNLDFISKKLSFHELEKQTLEIERVNITSSKKIIVENNAERINLDIQGIKDLQLNNLLSKYNELLLSKTQKSQALTPQSPDIILINAQLSNLKSAITRNILEQEKNNNKQIEYLNKQISLIQSDLQKMPQVERDFVNLHSQFDVNQKVYNYLLEKRLEVQISKAAITPGIIIIDSATFPVKPIAPVPVKIYLIFNILALAAVFGGFSFQRSINPYIYNLEDLNKTTDISIAGVIVNHQENKEKNELSFIKNSSSLFSESIRQLRFKLSFFSAAHSCKVTCITSEIAGEGKSFIACNLAVSLTKISQRVLLIAGDLRKSNLHTAFKISNRIGLSTFLSGQIDEKELIVKTSLSNLDFIPSGPYPPNPSELLNSVRMTRLLDSLKQNYDHIIIDLAPVGTVTDGLVFLKLSDLTLFIIRCGISKFQFAKRPEQLVTEQTVNKIAIVLNDYKKNDFYLGYHKAEYAGSTNGTYYQTQLTDSKYNNYLNQ